MDWIMVLTLGAMLLCLAFLFGYFRGMENLKTMENWGIGFDEGWENGWDGGFDYGYLCGLKENRKVKDALKELEREEV